MIKTLNKYIALFDYLTLLGLSATSGGVFSCSFATVIYAPVEIRSTGLSLVYVSNGITTRKIKRDDKKDKETHQNVFY